MLISGLSIREAFPVVSRNKVEAYLSEFSSLAQHFLRSEGKSQGEFTAAELNGLMQGLTPTGDEMIRQLYETGILLPNTSSRMSASKFIIPRLFRSGLGIVTMGRQSHIHNIGVVLMEQHYSNVKSSGNSNTCLLVSFSWVGQANQQRLTIPCKKMCAAAVICKRDRMLRHRRSRRLRSSRRTPIPQYRSITGQRPWPVAS